MNKKFVTVFSIMLALLLVKILILPGTLLEFKNYSTTIYDRNGDILRIYLNENEEFILPMGKNHDIPKKLEEAVIIYEDKNFYKHHGVDLTAVARAFINNIKYNKIVSGASTIPMQTIKIFRGGERTYFNKIIEIIYAFQLNFKYNKKEILNLYLSHSPYGGNIRGYQSACLRYFNKIPKQLTWSEAAVLAVIPNAPSLISNKRYHSRLLEKRNKLLLELYKAGKMTKEDYNLSLKENIPENLYPIPQKAIFFTDFVRKNTKDDLIKSTLDSNIQKKVEEIINFHKKKLEPKGIYNTAALVIDTKSAEILAYVGGDYGTDRGGRIDAIQIQRNSGSTLKPFLYTLAFDKGLISPDSMLEDVPSYFGSYNPVNSDRSYRGLVSSRKTLELSLNVPIVKLLEETGHYSFHSFLKESNISNIKNPDYYGLSMILGTVHLSPYELGELYATLGNLGERKKLKYIKNEKDIIMKRLYSRGSAWLTLDILKNVKRPNINWEFFQKRSQFYWKTGTSFGERDAWSAGCNKDFTIIVWNGNLDNLSSSKLRGIESSAPLMFDILNAISINEGTIEMPEKEIIETEASSNGYRSIYQNNSKVLMPQKAILKRDPYEKIIFTNLDESIEMDSRSFGKEKHKSIIINEYPSQVKYFLKLRGVEFSKIKRLNEKIKAHFIYPQEGIKIKIPKDSEGNREKIKVEAADIDSKEYYWYVNGSYMETTKKPKLFMTFDIGLNRIDLITDSKHSCSVSFMVE